MAIRRATRFTSWSFSRYADYRKCPLRAKLKHLDKIPEPQNPAAARGQDIGERLDKYLKRQTPTLPVECKPLKAEYAFLRKQKNNFVEEMWGFNQDWEVVPWNDWNNCWLRVKVDVGYQDLKENILHVIDNKTGKYKPEEQSAYTEQLELYTVAGIVMFPTANEVHTRLYYSDHGIQHPIEGPMIYSAKDAVKLRKTWTKRVQPMFNDTRFAPLPGRHCSWCPYSKNKGGQCKY